MAVVAKGEWSGKSGYGKRDFEFTGKYGFIDRRGNEVIAPIYDGAADFSEVLAAVGQMGKYYVRRGFIDAAGTLVIPCKYYEVSSFRNGRAVVCIVSGGALKYGSIDRNGREIYLVFTIGCSTRRSERLGSEKGRISLPGPVPCSTFPANR